MRRHPALPAVAVEASSEQRLCTDILMTIAVEILNHFGDAQPGAVGCNGRHGYLVETQSMRFFPCEPI